jgi:hypothetical protein
MKVKARDVVPGWPRGHSTSRPFDDFDSFSMYYGRRLWTQSEREQLQADIEANAEYHRRQAEIAAEFRARKAQPEGAAIRMSDETVVREFQWSDLELETKLMGLNFPVWRLPELLPHRDHPFTLFIRAREPDFLYPQGAPAERWEFRP